MSMSHNTAVADQRTCFSAHCKTSVRWGIASSVKKTNPDGSPLTLYACDDHERVLTRELRGAGTRYRLFPVEDQSPVLEWVQPITEKTSEPKKPSPVKRLITTTLVIIVGVVIGPFLIGYYGAKWLRGWRPSKDA